MSGVYTAGCMLGIKYLAVKAQDKLCCTDTDTWIRQFPKQSDTRIHLLFKK